MPTKERARARVNAWCVRFAGGQDMKWILYADDKTIINRICFIVIRNGQGKNFTSLDYIHQCHHRPNAFIFFSFCSLLCIPNLFIYCCLFFIVVLYNERKWIWYDVSTWHFYGNSINILFKSWQSSGGT